MSSAQSTYFTLLLGQVPALLIYMAGIVVCAFLWRRAPLPAMLAIGGIGIMVLATLISTGASAWMFHNRAAPGSTMSSSSIGMVMGIVSIGTTILRGGGLAMLLAGVFVQRQREDFSGFDVQQSTSRFNAPPPPPPLR